MPQTGVLIWTPGYVSTCLDPMNPISSYSAYLHRHCHRRCLHSGVSSRAQRRGGGGENRSISRNTNIGARPQERHLTKLCGSSLISQ